MAGIRLATANRCLLQAPAPLAAAAVAAAAPALPLVASAAAFAWELAPTLLMDSGHLAFDRAAQSPGVGE